VCFSLLSCSNISLPIWQGYETFESFSKAADMDELWGYPLDEEDFGMIMALAFLGNMFSGADNNINFDMVSGPKLTERYGVSEALRKNYDYLVKRSGIKGTTTYIAYFSGSTWMVLYHKE
jgi:hypothetical protein